MVQVLHDRAHDMRWQRLGSVLPLMLAACTGELVIGDGTGGDPPPPSGVDGGGGGGNAEELFNTTVVPLLELERPVDGAAQAGSCVSCHRSDGDNPLAAAAPDLLGADAGTMYSTVLQFSGARGAAVGGDANGSSLYTYGDHSGNGFDPGELPTIEAWIAAENP